ncbi:hypothetical protein AZH53_09610 [Methanomicrobiaceae archaeon CYW5]|nr:hypothetical protein [Methanovulcanius yangii]
MAATTEVHIIKYDEDGTTVLAETTVDYHWMEANLPVMGDGVTHYFHQGPVFIDYPDPEIEAALRWNPDEDMNVREKDMGALKGTNVKDLCDLVGGMDDGDEVKINAADGWYDYFAYENIYEYSSREGPVVLTWYVDDLGLYPSESYPDTGYYDGMRLVWFADDSTNPWGVHAFGAWDWHEAADEEYWYYYYGSPTEKYPTTTGLSGKVISRISIYSHPGFSAEFSADPVSGDAPLTVQFTDASTDALGWAWDFDNDGTVDSTGQNPAWTYTSGGTYTVTLTVTGDAGTATETKTDYITVTEVPIADFAADVTAGTIPLTVQFTDLSSANPTSWAWDFNGDSIVDSTLQNPSYTYDFPGTYTVALTVTNADGTDSAVKADYIQVAGVAPVAAFEAPVRSGMIPFEVQFVDQSANFPTSWEWNFGDRSTSTEQNPVHTYTKKGAYTVTLTVTNDLGTDTVKMSKYITVTDTPVSPTAAFTADVTEGPAPLTVRFTDYSADSPTSWAWDFESDGTVDSTEQHPTYTYDTAGTYTVTLTVTNAAGTDSEVKADYIAVTEGTVPPIASFIADVTAGEAPLTVFFTDISEGSPTSWAWDLDGDGVVDATTRNPVYNYSDVGTYTVSLTVSNDAGSDTVTQTGYIGVYADMPVHNLNTGAGYLTIRNAVDGASAGDVIEVADGEYTENVLVDKALTIRSGNGASAVTVTAASPALPVFDIDADGVTIEGFSVRGPTNEHVAGIEIVGFDDCLIIANDCAGCYNGIHIGGEGTNNTVAENYCHDNTQRGISIRDTAYENYLIGNTVSNNVDAGICIKDTPHDNVLWLNAVIGDDLEILTANVARSPEPLTYTYDGGIHTGYLGNYYSAYAGSDADGDGVGETVFTSGVYTDSYPLAGLPSEYAETVLFAWGPYLTGTTTTGTTVNVKTPEAAIVSVEYADDAYFSATGGYDRSATDETGALLHHVALADLSPGTLYHYRVVRDGGTTADLHFSTLPESGPFTFIFYGDSQDQLPTFSQEERHKLVADRIADEEDVAFVIHSGDLVNDATLTTDWDRFFAAGGPMLGNLTIFPALGNHEQNATLYYDIFGMPEWYSFDCGGAHFTVLDSNEWAWPAMSEQTTWLTADLAGPADWNFVAFHQPPYSSSLKHYGGYLNVREQWEDILTAGGVDMVMNGDVHAYERYFESGIMYTVMGTGGGPSYLLLDEEKIEGYRNSLELTLGYARVTIDPQAGTATVDVVPVAEISPDGSEVAYLYPEGSVYDTFVLGPPGAAFAADPLSGEAPLTVQFTDLSSNEPTGWAWDFDGDGTVDSTEQHPAWTYTAPGTYTVALTVTNAYGTDTATETDVVSVSALTADFAGAVEIVANGGFESGDATGWTLTSAEVVGGVANTGTYSVSLASTKGVVSSASQVIDLTGVNTLTYSFRINQATSGSLAVLIDGTKVDEYSSVIAWYRPTISVAGYSGEHTVTFEVTSGPTGKDILTAYVDDVSAYASSTEGALGYAPLTVSFRDLSSGAPTSWAWDLDGNGAIDATVKNPVHTYDQPGTYSVTLTASNAEGTATVTKSGFVTVAEVPVQPEPPTAAFSADPLTGTIPLAVSFTDLSSGEPTSWEWNFGDKGTSTEQNPVYTYTKKGSYTVTLTVTNEFGTDTLSMSKYITVLA